MHGLGLSPAAGENQLFSAGRRYTNLRECVLQSMASCSMWGRLVDAGQDLWPVRRLHRSGLRPRQPLRKDLVDVKREGKQC